MEFCRQDKEKVIFSNLFNQEHAVEVINGIQHPFNQIQFKNVGIKVMRLILQYFEEAPICKVIINYNWNTIMTTPQLICYDKNQWKTLQQLANWNREWNELFSVCFSLVNVELNISCSWMDDQFARKLLQGVVRLPNISSVEAEFSSKNQAVQDVLQAFSKAGIFSNYKYKFIHQK